MKSTLDRGELWSFLRRVLSQGGDIQLDYNNGLYKSYEEYAVRLDGAARERADVLWPQITNLVGEWTKDRPTVSGWYWRRWNGGTPAIVQILHAKGDERLYKIDDRGVLLDVDSGSLCEWAGPIPAPQERTP